MVNSRYAAAATIVALIAIGVSLAWILLDRTPPSWDDAGYLSKSLELYDSLGTNGIVGYVAKFVTVMHDKPPLIAAAPTPVYLTFGRSYRAAYFVNLFFLAITFASIYGIAKDFGTRRAGLIAVAVASSMPIVFALSHWYLVECGLIIQCRKTYTEAHKRPLGGMTLAPAKAEAILKLLCEGVSVRSIERLTDVHRDTILRLLVLVGEKCEKIMGRMIVNVQVRDVELDEIWSFVKVKEGHKRPNQANDLTVGDQYCFVAIERHTKLVLNFALGRRDQMTTNAFIEGLRQATAPTPYQVTADGFPAYPFAIETTLSDRCDFAQLIKVYRQPADGERRYSPAEVASTGVVPVLGNPDPDRICTSIVERQNLTIRMQMRRLTRLTNAFSKKWENLWAAYCLHFAWYNFCRVHRTLRVTPAMKAGITGKIWDIADLLMA